ncbi:MAG: riboflavin synthase [Bacteroidota bacterium]
MFTGIIETLGQVTGIANEGSNRHFTLSSTITHELKIDQSVSHNGVCLTVVAIQGNHYTVTAIKETLERTNLGGWKEGDLVNLERCMPASGRFDGHIVQGHVDTTAVCESIIDENGSWKYFFSYNGGGVTVEKGSITVNGTSLTVVDSESNRFSVAIIPYTYDNTVFKTLKVGDKVNIEFDIVGKYIAHLLKP